MRRPLVILSLALALLTLLLYWPVSRYAFVDYDDSAYVTENPFTRDGMTWSGVQAVFHEHVLGYWQPLTLLSHMLDCQFFGQNPGAHHLVNLLFHLMNTVLLFLLLQRMTGHLWRSACVAALFAWHPLHVESVAWIAERKDVLSTLFWSLAIWFYLDYARDRKRLCYALSLLSFGLGLLAKSMVVTLPCLLLLLDYWPLQRLPLPPVKNASTGPAVESGWPEWLRQFGTLALEKVPYFILSAALSLITYSGQKTGNSFISDDVLPLDLRAANGFVAYLRYLSKTVWPQNMAVFYPHPGVWPAALVITAILTVVTLTVLAVWQVRRRPWVTVGWLWFLGTLFPAIGVVQAGWHSLADHFTYVPLTGLFIIAVWAGAEAVNERLHRPRAGWALAAVALIAMAAVTRLQLPVWANTYNLFSHALAVTEHNAVAEMGLGNELLRRGQTTEAVAHLHKTIEIYPYYVDGWNNLGFAYLGLHRTNDALDAFNRATRIAPNDANSHFNLGTLLTDTGDLTGAKEHLHRAVELRPSLYEARNNYANLLANEGKHAEAVAEYEQALQIRPNLASTHLNLANSLTRLGRFADALPHYDRAYQLDPQEVSALSGRGLALLRLNRLDDAAETFAKLVQVAPGDAIAHMRLGILLSAKGNQGMALLHLREAVRLQPDRPEVLQPLARLLATLPQDNLRNGAEAVRLAEHLTALTRGQSPMVLDTLAAAYAEAGQFDKAVAAEEKALTLLRGQAPPQYIASLEQNLAQYRNHQPLREDPGVR